MTEHSPEPWAIDLGSVEDANGDVVFDLVKNVAYFDGDSDPMADEDVTRIIACVNACKGIPTDLLNKLTAEHGGILKDVTGEE